VPTGEPELQRLLDVEAIRDVVRRYCRGIDRVDLDLVRDCYHPDATDTHGSFSGTVDEFLVWVERLLGRYDATFHLIGNHLVELVDTADGAPPTIARSEAYGVAHHRSEDPDPKRNLTVGFRFLDRFERRDGGWRIARRVATTEWVTALAPEQRWPMPESGALGLRGHDDPLYDLVPELAAETTDRAAAPRTETLP
jgi:hypothetical protein